MSQLKLAVTARIPIIACTTRDTVNCTVVIKHLVGQKPVDLLKANEWSDNTLYMVTGATSDKLDIDSVYGKMAKLGSVLIVVNPKKMNETMFWAGELPVPKDMKQQYLSEIVDDAKMVEQMIGALGGCTLKESVEMALLTMARDKSITPQGLTRTRKTLFFGTQGLTQVDTTQAYYNASKELAGWSEKNKSIFFDAPDQRLQPRGLLFKGPPGTGKTEGAKYIANRFGCPLFRLDISATKNKYVGESSANLAAGLSKVDTEEPCILLIDEIEKVFATGDRDGSGVTTDMLSQVLWWLAEHKTRVLTIMTTNDVKKLPKELYREGRIDGEMYFGGLNLGEATKFAKGLLGTFKIKGVTKSATELIDNAITEAFNHCLEDQPDHVAHAKLTKAIYDQIIASIAP